jgi:hypothetical protein
MASSRPIDPLIISPSIAAYQDARRAAKLDSNAKKAPRIEIDDAERQRQYRAAARGPDWVKGRRRSRRGFGKAEPKLDVSAAPFSSPQPGRWGFLSPAERSLAMAEVRAFIQRGA